MPCYLLLIVQLVTGLQEVEEPFSVPVGCALGEFELLVVVGEEKLVAARPLVEVEAAEFGEAKVELLRPCLPLAPLGSRQGREVEVKAIVIHKPLVPSCGECCGAERAIEGQQAEESHGRPHHRQKAVLCRRKIGRDNRQTEQACIATHRPKAATNRVRAMRELDMHTAELLLDPQVGVRGKGFHGHPLGETMVFVLLE